MLLVEGDEGRYWRRAWLLVAAWLLLIAACGQPNDSPVADGDDASEATAADEATGDRSAGEDGEVATFMQLLRFVPADDDGLDLITITDYERASRAVGLELPVGAAPDSAEVQVWLEKVFVEIRNDDGSVGASAVRVGFGKAPELFEGWRTDFGFSIVEARAALDVGVAPEDVQIYLPVASSEAIDAAVRADPVWGPALEVRDGPGGPYYHWSDDGELDYDRQTDARLLGRGGLGAVRDGVFIRAVMGESFLQSLEAAEDQRSAADDPGIAGIVSILDRYGVYSLLLSNRANHPPDPVLVLGSDGLTEAEDPEARLEAVLGEGDGLEPYLRAGAGHGLDGGTHVVVLAFAHGDETAAAANVDRLRILLETGASVLTEQPWAERLAVRQVASEGTISYLVADLLDGPPRIWLDAFVRQDSLYWIVD